MRSNSTFSMGFVAHIHITLDLSHTTNAYLLFNSTNH